MSAFWSSVGFTTLVSMLLSVSGRPIQEAGVLGETLRRELVASFFMDQALELLEVHPDMASSRSWIEANVPGTVQFMGEQTRGDEVTAGYVARSPETFVSITLFFDRESGAMRTVHVVMSPGMWSRALGMIEGAFASDTSGEGPASQRTYLLGLEDLGAGRVQVSLSERESDLGTIYALSYTRI